MRFQNRTEAGQKLAAALKKSYARCPRGIVLGLPRGGVVVAAEIAKELQLPLDVALVRKLGVPDQPELAMGAIAPNGVMVLNTPIVRSMQISKQMLQSVAAAEQRELQRRERLYRGDRPPLNMRNRVVIVVDDGIATGSTLRAVIAALQPQQPEKIVIAVPVAPPESVIALAGQVDEVVCLTTPDALQSIGLWYDDFTQTSDEEVFRCLRTAPTEAIV